MDDRFYGSDAVRVLRSMGRRRPVTSVISLLKQRGQGARARQHDCGLRHGNGCVLLRCSFLATRSCPQQRPSWHSPSSYQPLSLQLSWSLSFLPNRAADCPRPRLARLIFLSCNGGCTFNQTPLTVFYCRKPRRSRAFPTPTTFSQSSCVACPTVSSNERKQRMWSQSWRRVRRNNRVMTSWLLPTGIRDIYFPQQADTHIQQMLGALRR
jgi:hypothetical protein